ncbi:MAG: ATP-dependent DNA helicase DinG [Gammaproteobacteria bacterium]|nr:ATP-dependent DNA helicase DinG [Gammaproteobacteria bacterium]
MTTSALSSELRNRIQEGYRAWLEARQFRARRGQREMIAQIARTLTGDEPRIVAIEAGTGTGKTAAYCLAAVPIAQALGKTIVISSATVALQEQVVLRDLPDLKRNTGFQFDFALAKGRGRYLCLKRLDDRLKYSGQQEIPLFDTLSENNTALYQSMLVAFGDRSWDGEFDSWPHDLDQDSWRAVTTDHRGCTNNRCGFFKPCPFFKARNRLEGVDVIVANHDLVLADLSLGGGVVLPEPEDCIYILDEAHHFPEKTQQHFSVSARLRATTSWADTVASTLGSLTQRFGRPAELLDVSTAIADFGPRFASALTDLADGVAGLDYQPRDETLDTHRFPLGKIPDEIAELAANAAKRLVEVESVIDRAHELLQKAFAGELDWERNDEAEAWLAEVGQLQTRALATIALLDDFADSGANNALHARWVNRHESDLELISAPIEPGRLLEENLWSRCFAAICTSATLTALGRFERFFERVGLSDCVGLRIPSPFDFPRIASLTVPRMNSDPRDFTAHSEEVATLLPKLLADDPSGLVLFTSWRQMNEVCNQLPPGFYETLKIQGKGSKQTLLEAHNVSVEAGEKSYLVGLASFAEGVDLPDDLCRHVIIVKLPFSVPDDPIDQAMAEWAEAKGKNPFYEISVPDAALKLEQACGRLIRHEGDYGRITLLDRRIVTQRYGRALLDSLPPYRLILNGA